MLAPESPQSRCVVDALLRYNDNERQRLRNEVAADMTASFEVADGPPGPDGTFSARKKPTTTSRSPPKLPNVLPTMLSASGDDGKGNRRSSDSKVHRSDGRTHYYSESGPLVSHHKPLPPSLNSPVFWSSSASMSDFVDDIDTSMVHISSQGQVTHVGPMDPVWDRLKQMRLYREQQMREWKEHDRLQGEKREGGASGSTDGKPVLSPARSALPRGSSIDSIVIEDTTNKKPLLLSSSSSSSMSPPTAMAPKPLLGLNDSLVTGRALHSGSPVSMTRRLPATLPLQSKGMRRGSSPDTSGQKSHSCMIGSGVGITISKHISSTMAANQCNAHDDTVPTEAELEQDLLKGVNDRYVQPWKVRAVFSCATRDAAPHHEWNYFEARMLEQGVEVVWAARDDWQALTQCINGAWALFVSVRSCSRSFVAMICCCC